MRLSLLLPVLLLLAVPVAAQPDAPPRTILAVGAHAGDVELTSGALP